MLGIEYVFNEGYIFFTWGKSFYLGQNNYLVIEAYNENEGRMFHVRSKIKFAV